MAGLVPRGVVNVREVGLTPIAGVESTFRVTVIVWGLLVAPAAAIVILLAQSAIMLMVYCSVRSPACAADSRTDGDR